MTEESITRLKNSCAVQNAEFFREPEAHFLGLRFSPCFLCAGTGLPSLVINLRKGVR